MRNLPKNAKSELTKTSTATKSIVTPIKLKDAKRDSQKTITKTKPKPKEAK